MAGTIQRSPTAAVWLDMATRAWWYDKTWGGGKDGLRHGLWRVIEARYREAVEALLDR